MPATFSLLYAPTGTVTAASLAQLNADLTTNGIVRQAATGGTALQVTAGSSGLTVNVANGDWFYNGYLVKMTGGPQTLTLASNNSGSTRIDRIVAQIDTTATPWNPSIAIVQGTPGSGAPAINTNPNIWQLSLAQVSVANGASSLTNANITDERSIRSVCGWAIPQLHGVDHGPGGADPVPMPLNLAYPGLTSLNATGANPTATIVQQSLGNGATYTVPTGQMLLLMGVTLTANASTTVNLTGSPRLLLNNYAASIAFWWPVPWVFAAGQIITSNGGTTGLFGLLVPASSKITPVATTLAYNNASYTVPTGSWFVLMNLGTGQSNTTLYLQLNGANWSLPGTNYYGVYETGSGTSGTVTGGFSIIDGNGVAAPVVPAPVLLPPGSVIGASGNSNLPWLLNGYLMPTTG